MEACHLFVFIKRLPNARHYSTHLGFRANQQSKIAFVMELTFSGVWGVVEDKEINKINL